MKQEPVGWNAKIQFNAIRCRWIGVIVAAHFLFSAWIGVGQSISEYELSPIEYSESEASNRVSIIQKKLELGTLSLPRGSHKKFVEAFLESMSVPVDTQVLVFSLTSFQRDLIHPKQPRAMYFSDDCYIGWVPGGLMEVAVTDPKLGIVFYHLNPREESKAMKFTRDRECLSCHGGSMTRNWPGLIVRSVYPDSSGNPITSAGGFFTDHQSRIEDRWGGWYVTGEHGSLRHMGNAIGKRATYGAELDRESGANLKNLDQFFPTKKYPRPGSDILALMVLEHQVGMHNRLSTGSLRVRKWTHYQRQLQKELGETVTDEPTGSALLVVQSEAKRILEYLFFAREVRLSKNSIQGNDVFQTAFRKNRREDAEGRSLKDFNIRSRLFAYRCSYMVYSESFESMPDVLKKELYRRMIEILSAESPPKEFAHLSSTERRAIHQILLATHDGFASAWQQFSKMKTLKSHSQ